MTLKMNEILAGIKNKQDFVTAIRHSAMEEIEEEKAEELKKILKDKIDSVVKAREILSNAERDLEMTVLKFEEKYKDFSAILDFDKAE